MAPSTQNQPVMVTRASTKREQREVSTARILASALKLFVSKGYRSATVDDIASASELTKGAVYFYFPTKAAILLALLDEIEDVLVRKMVARVSQAGPKVADKLIAFLHSGAGMGNDKPNLILLFILMLLEFNGVGDEVELRVKAIYQQICVAVEEVVSLGKLAGEFRTDLETHEIAAIVMAMYNGTFMEWYCRPSYLRGRELVRAAREITLHGILNPAA
jgi:AcrR family transcriptional regulator